MSISTSQWNNNIYWRWFIIGLVKAMKALWVFQNLLNDKRQINQQVENEVEGIVLKIYQLASVISKTN